MKRVGHSMLPTFMNWNKAQPMFGCPSESAQTNLTYPQQPTIVANLG